MKKDKILTLIKKYGLLDLSRLSGISVYDILKISDISFVPEYEIINEILFGLNQKNKIDFYFKEFNIYYDNDGLIYWNGSLNNIDDDYIFNISAYVTPYYDSTSSTPISIFFYEILNSEHHQIISDDIDIGSYLNSPNYFDNVNSFEDWFYNTYTTLVRSKLISILRKYKDDLMPI